jgi:TetR/AcrR family transcriptional regulator, cholesterol catabolism regulator
VYGDLVIKQENQLNSKAKAAARVDIASRKQAFVRDEILSSATRLFAEKGYRAVTIDDIAANLGYTKSVVYYYFKSKNEILWQIINRIYDGFMEKVIVVRDQDGEPGEILSRMVRQHALNVMENPEWTSIFNREESELEPQQRKQIRRMKRDYDAAYEVVYTKGVASGRLRDIPAHVAVSGALGMCNWLYVWYDPKGELSAEAIADHYAGILTNGWTS